MRTKAEHVANVLAVAIWADGEYDEIERATVSEIAEALGYTTVNFEKLVEGSVGMLKSAEEKVNDILQASAKKVLPSEKGLVFEAAIEIELANSVIDYQVIERLLEVASALDVDMEDAIKLIADMVNPDADTEDDIIATITNSNGDFDALVDGVIDLCDKIHSPETFVIEK